MGARQLSLAGIRSPDRFGRAPCRAVIHLHCTACRHRAKRRLVCSQRCDACPAEPETRSNALLRLLPPVPVRQWTLTLPATGGGLPSRVDALLASAARSLVAEVFAMHRSRADVAPGQRAECGAVAVAHRFDAALDRALHVQVLAVDGVYVNDGATPKFLRGAPRPDHVCMQRVAARLGATAGRRAKHPRKARRRAVTPPVPREMTRRVRARGSSDRLPSSVADIGDSGARAIRMDVGGFAVSAGDAIEPRDQVRLAATIRRVVHPPFATPGFEPMPGGRVRYQLDHTGPDGVTHIELPYARARARLSTIARERNAGHVSYHGLLAGPAAEPWFACPPQLRLVAAPPRQRGSAAAGASPQETSQCPHCGGPLHAVACEERDDIAMWRHELA